MKVKSVHALVRVAFVVVCFQMLALGQTPEDRNRIATISSSGLTIKWDVSVPHSELTLTISAPDGQVYRKEFKGGGSAEVSLTDLKAADGQYTYELRVTPPIPADVRAKLAAARANGNDAEVSREFIRRGVLSAQPPVVSGGFSILNGSIIVAGSLEEGTSRRVAKAPAPARVFRPVSGSAASENPMSGFRRHHAVVNPFFDFVIADDLIVQGSGCFGLDCVDGESFGFDTIRVKENNTRIQFDDTSTSAGFATNNWQIRANAQGSGGASFLAFVDQGATGNSETGTIVLEVDAGAPANSLRVGSTGKVGLRTATPVLDLHANTTDTPAIRLEQNNSGGFTAQTWDVAGNEANFFVRDVTSGSRLPFRIRPGAPTSSIDIAADGKVGIGTASPDSRLSVLGASATFPTTYNPGDVATFVTATDSFTTVAILKGGIANPQGLHFGVNQASLFSEIQASRNGVATNTLVLNRQGGNVGIGTSAPTDLLSVNGNASKPGGGSWAVFSDERLKTIKGPFTTGLKAVMQLQPLRYEYRRDNALGLKSEGEHIGFGAQAVAKIIPAAVVKTDTGYLQVNNDPIIWTMLNAIKEQQKQIEELKAEVRKLRATSRRRR